MTGESPSHDAVVSRTPNPPLDPYALEHRWIRMRLIGWALVALWQILSLASEFADTNPTPRTLRILGKVLGLVGVILVAIGFERLVEMTHDHEKRHLRLFKFLLRRQRD